MALRIVVTGAGGQLGQVLVRDFQKTHEVYGLTRESLDITDRGAVAERIQKLRPTVVVNCAAYNDVDGAEENPKAALAANAFGVSALADAARTCDAVFVHFGSDFVFDGTGSRPYIEKDPPNPLSVYGASKLLGEILATRAPKHYVVRLESVFGGAGHGSSIGRMADAFAKGDPVRAFVDRTVSPSFVDDVSRATRRLIEKGAPFGLYHCVSTGFTNWMALAQELAKLMGKPPNIAPVNTERAGLKAPRPRFCALSNDKLSGVGIEMPDWSSALARFVAGRS